MPTHAIRSVVVPTPGTDIVVTYEPAKGKEYASLVIVKEGSPMVSVRLDREDIKYLITALHCAKEFSK